MLAIHLYPVVEADQAKEYANYTREHLDWLPRGRALQRDNGFEMTDNLEDHLPFVYTNGFATPPLSFDEYGTANEIFTFDPTFSSTVVDPGPGKVRCLHFFLVTKKQRLSLMDDLTIFSSQLTPLWQSHPVIPAMPVNLNVMRFPQFGEAINATVRTGQALLGGFDVAPANQYDNTELTGYYFSSIISYREKKLSPYEGDPFSTTYVPIFDSFDRDNRTMVALLVTAIKWSSYFENIIPPGTGTLTVVLENTCDGAATYNINGPDVTFMGMGDKHEKEYADLVETTSFDRLINAKGSEGLRITLNQEWCAYSIRVYPTRSFESEVESSSPVLITAAVAAIFIFTAVLFLIYNWLVERRQILVMNTAEKSTALVSSLFPKNVQDRLLEAQNTSTQGSEGFTSDKKRVESFLSGNQEGSSSMKPIADLFPHTTVIFADISGFTSWSSSREPGHVFILLQTVYQAFDLLAQKHKVFKVETIGDSVSSES